MAFPTTGILDAFDRGDESPVAGIWTGPFFTAENQLRIVSQELTIITGGEGNSYINSTYGPDLEAYFTLASSFPSGSRILIYFRSTTGADIEGYRIDIRNNAGDHIVNVDRMNGADPLTQLGGTSIDPDDTFADGDKFGVEMIGDTINVYYDAGGDGSWTLLGTRTDSTYTGAGYIGLALVGSLTIDDFGGGSTPVGRIYKRFHGPAQLTGSAADLYTCPASTIARTLHIHASNPSGSPVDVNLSIGADAAATRVWDDLAIPADGVKDVFDPYELTAGEKIQGWADSAGTVVVTITGYEDPV